MSRSAEATFWQSIGAVLALAGGLLLAYDFERYGLAPIQPLPLTLGLASSFVLLIAGACYISGRALHVRETTLTPREAVLWKALGAVGLIAGAAVVMLAWREQALVLDRITMGIAGAFSITFGILCLLGQRVMSHMNVALAGEKATGARAS